MEFDLSQQPVIVQQAADFGLHAWEIAQSWALSPAAWSQFALLIVAYVAAVLVARRLGRWLTRVLTPAPEIDTVIARARRTALIYLPLLLPLLAYVFTAAGESVVPPRVH